MMGQAKNCKKARYTIRMSETMMRRPRAIAAAAGLALALHPLSMQAAGTEEQPVTLSIANDDAETLRCMFFFAHFVVTDVGTIVPGTSLSITMFRQQSDGALWMPRNDGRRMMIETIDCGAVSRWAETRGQISLLPARAGRDLRYSARCHLDGKVVCDGPMPLP